MSTTGTALHFLVFTVAARLAGSGGWVGPGGGWGLEKTGTLAMTLLQNHPRLLAAGLDVCRTEMERQEASVWKQQEEEQV